MRWAVDGWRPDSSLMCFNETGSGNDASTSSKPNARSSTWIVGLLFSDFAMRKIVAQPGGFLYCEKMNADPGLNAHQAASAWRWACRLTASLAMAGAAPVLAALPMPAVATAPVVASTAAAWQRVPKIQGRITNRELGIVINTADPYSVAVGESYIEARGLTPAQVLRIALPVKPVLTQEEFNTLDTRVRAFFKPTTQALALAWSAPFAVDCNSITSALTLGFDASVCVPGCQRARSSPYFNAATSRPYTDLGIRPTMLLAAPDVAGAQALIQRGVAADRSLGLRGAPPVHAYFAITADAARSVRFRLFPPPGPLPRAGVDVHVEPTEAIGKADRVLLYQTGLARVEGIAAIHWVPGALADHLTSFGGQLLGAAGGQMPALDWIAAGATASYGTVSEPCNYLEKFPHPQLLLLNYLQGSTALEAYWKSVAWPQQGVFIGEPLAAPFARR